MSFRVLVFVGASIAVSSLVTRAEEPLTPKDAAALAIAENRDLAAARFAIRQAEGRLLQAGLRPNPEVEMRQGNDILFANEGEYDFSLGFKQRFPLTGRLAKAKAVGRVDVAQARAEVRNQERLLAGNVLGLARDWLLIREKLETNRQLQDYLRQLIDVSEKRMKAAEVSPTDVNIAKLELERLALAQGELLSQIEATATKLNGQLGREPDATLTLTGNLDAQFDPTSSAAADREAPARRPDRQLALLGVDRAEAERVLARAGKWEDITVGLDYGRTYGRFAAPVGGKLDNSIALSVSVPLPLWNKNQGRISEAQATGERAVAEVRALDLRIATEIKTAEARMLRLAGILDRYRTASTQLAEDNLALLQKGYAQGIVNITTVIQAQQQLTELRLSYLDTLGEFIRAKTDWEIATASVPASPAAN